MSVTLLCLLAASCQAAPRAPSSDPAGGGASSPQYSDAGTRPLDCSRARPPAASCIRPNLVVTPSARLRTGQRVMVRVSGFAADGKVYLSECAAASDVTAAGCGPQLVAQRRLVTGGDRSARGVFIVRDRAPARPFSFAGSMRCADRCVIVATMGLGLGRDYASVPIAFSKLPWLRVGLY